MRCTGSDATELPGGKTETSFPSSRFLRLGEKSSQTVEAEGRGSKSALCHFDANGNLTNDGNGNTYAYDAKNRLISVTQGGTTTGYVYDGFGRRVQETLSGTVMKQWVWCDGTQPCEERDGSNNVTKRFYTQGEILLTGSNAGSYFFTKDYLRSVREMTNASGSMVARYDYDPYGRRTLVSGTDLADFGFTGFYYDQATGLNLTLTRAYVADLGRWLSRDPLGEKGGINVYSYVRNSPINRVDRLGLQAEEPPDEPAEPVEPEPAPGRDEPVSPPDAAFEPGPGSPSCPQNEPEPMIRPQAGPRNPIIPDSAADVVDYAKANNGASRPGYIGNRPFQNDGRGGGQALPKCDGNGNPVNYKEYDIYPIGYGVNRGPERVVIGSDGSAYYTGDHYQSFTPF